MRLYNTLTRKKDEFIPLTPGRVLMYSCGPTVYNYFHIGNARPFIIFDTLRRYLEYKGFNVKFVQNFTDVDDKMILNAKKDNITVKELAERFIKEYFIDSMGLGIKEASCHPLATENIDEIINMVSTLIEKGYAYNVDGDVYFRTKKFNEYGKLSHQPLDQLEVGARIDVNEQKEDPMDFALWKKQKEEGEIFWESPFGKGRPGWHIECSAMAKKYLGDTIDIHSGGQDLIFPHHENEIAQSECANNASFARYWLHNGYINVDNQKMSKSKNNFFTVRDISKEYDYEVIRFFMLSAHYRSPINFSKELMQSAKTGYERLMGCLENLDFLLKTALDKEISQSENDAYNKILQYETAFNQAMDDDINTADAIAALFEAVREINSNVNEKTSKGQLLRTSDLLSKLYDVLGLLKKKDSDIPDEIINMVNERATAKKNKDFALADKLRDDITAKGYMVEDTAAGAKVKKI